MDTLFVDVGFAPFVNARNFSLLYAFTLTLLDNGSLKLSNSPKDRQIKLGCTVRTLWRESQIVLDETDAERLEAVGFVWDPLADAWEDGFKQLEIFIERTGHGRVPDKFVQNGYRLGQWVGVQRINKDQMSADRRQKLNAIGFVWSAK